MSQYEQAALYEHRFWLQILGDHARFIFNALSPRETNEIQRANSFIQLFDELLMEARRELSADALALLNQEAARSANEIREFKLHLLRRELVGEIAIELPPTFLNHTLNEVGEYLRKLSYILKGQIPPVVNPIHHHLLWLPDASFHAAIIWSRVDAVERRLISRSRVFEKHFDDLYLKAIELAGYMRTNLRQFPALSAFNRDVDLEMTFFMKFLTELEEMEINKTLLGTTAPLLFDHMWREECYYLTMLSQSEDTPRPDCDATKPRVE